MSRIIDGGCMYDSMLCVQVCPYNFLYQLSSMSVMFHTEAPHEGPRDRDAS
jgi:hypothetical protein